MQVFFRLVFLLLISSFSTWAQDSLQVQRIPGADKAYFLHKVAHGDNIDLLAKKYNVPIIQLQRFNNVQGQQGLERGSEFKIPVIANNYNRKEKKGLTKPIYYIVQDSDNLKSICRMFDEVNQSTIQTWNQMPDNRVQIGQRLMTGWVACNEAIAAFTKDKEEQVDSVHIPEAQATKINVDSLRQHIIDSLKAASYNPKLESRKFEETFKQQTNGFEAQSASGAAVFYALKMRVKKGVYYAFHNTASRGTILKITNPANGKVIYAKVLGPIPQLGEYEQAVVTISNNAIGELGARDKRMFCRIQYR